MPPHPKRKHSKSRRNMRRAHDALQPRNLTACSNCGSMRLPHTVCPNCGFYEGREVVEIKKDKRAYAEKSLDVHLPEAGRDQPA